MKRISLLLLLILASTACISQTFTRQDTLRGSITPEREWWDVLHYNLNVAVQPSEKTISGTNIVTYLVKKPHQVLQIDLQAPMKLDKVMQDGKQLSFTSEGNAHFVQLQKNQKKGKENKITFTFSGKPQVAKRAPWDGGFTWTKDSNGKPFIATSNQGIGASIWWPNKDHDYDEPNRGATMAVTTPKDLMNVSNGRLLQEIDNGATKTWVWEVVNPINNYGININIGDYVHFEETFTGEKGPLDMDYYVLRENEEKAKKQFQQAPLMMKAFEHWFGPYPFYEDSFKLVEAPYLGMEHQSSVTYGNKYQNGYLGNDLSGSGWGLKFDFIIIHEAGHEWFANNITNYDVADMWIHEGFTAYSESLYLDYHFGSKAASEYVLGTRKMISNDRPVIGIYNVNYPGSGDMYYKGANVLHTLRNWINDDALWRDILRGLNKEFYHQTVTSQQVEKFIAEKSGLDLTAFWDQYLRTVKIPEVAYKIDGNTLHYRYTNTVEGFKMPVIAVVNSEETWIAPSAEWQKKEFPATIKEVQIKKDFYVTTEEVKENPPATSPY